MKYFKILACVLLAGCIGTDVGNPPAQPDDAGIKPIRLLSTLEFAPYGGPEDPGDVQVTAVWLSIAQLRVTDGTSDSCSGAPRTIDGPFVVELIGRELLSDPPILATEPTSICRLVVALGPAPSDIGPPELAGLSVLLRAAGPDGPFDVSTTSQRALPFRGTGFVIESATQDDRIPFIHAFDPTNWLSSSPESPNAALQRLLKSLTDDSRIVEDADRDGAINLEEFAAPVALPDP